jgi:hypothetical protein
VRRPFYLHILVGRLYQSIVCATRRK